ncbi:MAG TPA: hypothetical protein H9769_10555, partial [Candidatus Microbacterium pullistercoris]|nr:hypothetical protein [Candidatus Microbacterium pullistercoris]
STTITADTPRSATYPRPSTLGNAPIKSKPTTHRASGPNEGGGPALLYERTAELILLSNSRWIGAGKYLPRRLTEFDPDRAAALATPLIEGQHDRFATQIEIELDRAGGRIQEGFQR